MGQEFIIKSQNLEDKINQLLPSQGGYGASVDLSASTTVIPIVDLTETAEGSLLRQDLQTSYSLTSTTFTEITSNVVTVINTTGYYRCFGNISFNGGGGTGTFSITDGITSKTVLKYSGTGSYIANDPFDFVIFLGAGDSFVANSNSATAILRVATRQVADINGNLTNP